MRSNIQSHGKIARVMMVLALSLMVVAFVGQVVLAGPGCGGGDKTKGCASKTGEGKSGCSKTTTIGAKTAKITAASATAHCEKSCTKEESLAKSMALGMTKEQAEGSWNKHSQLHNDGLIKTASASAKCDKSCTKEECIAACMAQGMTKDEAEACWTKHGKNHGDGLIKTAAATSVDAGCPHAAKQANVIKANAVQTTGKDCSKESCIAKMMADGMSKTDAEAKYATRKAEGKCSGKAKSASVGSGCGSAGGKK